MNSRYAEEDSLFLMVGILLFALLYKTRSLFREHYLLVGGVIVFSTLLLSLGATLFLRRKKSLRPDAWSKMSGRAFEDQVVIWLKQSGYAQVMKTEYYDDGVDILAVNSGRIFGVQVKRSSRPVGVAAVRAVLAGLKSYGCDQAMVITNAKFTTPAVRLAQINDCQLIDGQSLKRRLP